MTDREDTLYQARLADQLQRPEDVIAALRKIATLNLELTDDEQTLLGEAYRKIGSKHRLVMGLIKIRDPESTAVQYLKKKVYREFISLFHDVIKLVDENLLPSSERITLRLSFYRLKGDFHRYMAEFSEGADRDDAIRSALTSYSMGSSEAASNKVTATHTELLSMALNHSLLLADIMHDCAGAAAVARLASVIPAPLPYALLEERCQFCVLMRRKRNAAWVELQNSQHYNSKTMDLLRQLESNIRRYGIVDTDGL